MTKNLRGGQDNLRDRVRDRHAALKQNNANGDLKIKMKEANNRWARKGVTEDMKKERITGRKNLSKEMFLKFKESIKDLPQEERLAKKKEWFMNNRKTLRGNMNTAKNVPVGKKITEKNE